MPRNLMVTDPNPGVLDFQDAVHGPITYDVVSLMRDAFVSWDEERVLDWTRALLGEGEARGAAGGARISACSTRDFEWMGLQRHLKVLGIFARIRYRDGKSGYLEDTPRFVALRARGRARATASSRRSRACSTGWRPRRAAGAFRQIIGAFHPGPRETRLPNPKPRTPRRQ